MVFGVLVYAGLVLLSGVGVLWGIGSLLVGFDRYEEEQAIRTTPLSSLDSAAVGPVAVRGRVEPVGRTIGSLHPCEECVAYELDVSDFGSDTSEAHVDRAHTVPFDIVTDEGSIRVDEKGFDFHVSDRREWDRERKSHESADEALQWFERNFGVPPLRSGDDRQYTARYLCPGDEVYAYGTVDIDTGRSEQSPKPLLLTGRDDLFFISDRGQDELLRERRFALAKESMLGIVVAVASLAAFLWLTGIAQIFLGA